MNFDLSPISSYGERIASSLLRAFNAKGILSQTLLSYWQICYFGKIFSAELEETDPQVLNLSMFL